MAAVLEKNPELEDKPETKKTPLESLPIKPCPLPSGNNPIGIAPKLASLAPKFYHHFACQRIFADKSFGKTL